MKEPKTVEIDGQKYLIGALPTSSSLKVLTLITKKILGPIGRAFENVPAGKIENILDADFDISAALTALADNLDQDEVVETIQTLFSMVKPFGKESLNFESLAQEYSMSHVFILIKEAMEVNYGDFLEGSGGGLKAVMAGILQGKAKSTGSSGGQSSQGAGASSK